MMKLLRFLVRIFIEMFSEVRKLELPSRKLRIMLRSNIIVQDVAADIRVEKFTNLTADGYNSARQWVSNRPIEYTTFHLKNVNVS